MEIEYLIYVIRSGGTCAQLFSRGILGIMLDIGEVPEWTIGAVSKTVVGLGPPWVRIPPSPQVVKSLDESPAATVGE